METHEEPGTWPLTAAELAQFAEDLATAQLLQLVDRAVQLDHELLQGTTKWGPYAGDGEEAKAYRAAFVRATEDHSLDITSSASRQHFIDTGRYLTKEESGQAVFEEAVAAEELGHTTQATQRSK